MFKDAAKDLMSGGDSFKDWENFSRVEAEEEAIRGRIRRISAETGIDMTPLFASIAKERQQQAKHKENVDLYKRFRFLKKDQVIESLKNPVIRDEFDFPSMKDSVSHLFHKESRHISSILDDSEPEHKYGRRTGYSQTDFIKEYLGHDVLKSRQLNHERDIYTYSD